MFIMVTAMVGHLADADAQNPIIQTSFTPDPAPYVHGDTVYLFVDHDEDDEAFFHMKDWQLYTSTDMLNWTYRGTPLKLDVFKWARPDNNAWAAQAIERNGKWYWYAAVEDTVTKERTVAVAVADRPEGPYTDAIGHALVGSHPGYIDPTIFIDDDGTPWLFWGNNGCWYVQLKPDMIHLASEPRMVEGLDDPKAFGPLVKKTNHTYHEPTYLTNYEEGPWLYKRHGKYYLIYASHGLPEHMAYATATSIHGPWTYQGEIMSDAPNSFTIHGGNIDFKGRHFMFYHNAALPNGSSFRRSTCVEEFEFEPDGRIPFIKQTPWGVTKAAGPAINPYQRVEAETMASSYGLKTDREGNPSRHYLKKVDMGDWTLLRNVDFGTGGARTFVCCVAGTEKGGSIEMRIDNTTVAELFVEPTGSNGNWQEQRVAVTTPMTGVHDVKLYFKGGDEELFRFDYWMLER